MASYGTEAGLAAYATATGRTLSGDAAILLSSATYYIDGTYWHMFKGSPASDDNYFEPAPDRVVNATYEAALLVDGNPTALTVAGVTNNGSGAVASEKVDVISVSYHAPSGKNTSGDTVVDNAPRYSVIENILRPLLKRYYGADAAAFVV